MATRPLDQIRAAIEPGAAAAAAKARAALAGRAGLGSIEALAIQLAAARHTPLPPTARKIVVCAAADRPGAAPDPALAAAVAAVAAGSATVNVLARAAGARVVVVDAGLGQPVGAGVVELRPGAAAEFAYAAAEAAVEAGAALALSLAGEGLDALGLGGLAPEGLARAAARALRDADADPFTAAAEAGAPAIAVLAGVCLGAAAIRIPVVVDGELGAIAAAYAARLAPAVTDSVILGHAPTAIAAEAVRSLGATAVLDAGLTAGAGATAALAFPVIDAASRLLREPVSRRSLPLVPES